MDADRCADDRAVLAVAAGGCRGARAGCQGNTHHGGAAPGHPPGCSAQLRRGGGGASRDRPLDAAWLAELRDREHDPFSEVALYRILLAGGQLEEGDLASVHAELEQAGDLEKINECDRRRYWALKARIARLEGDGPAERDAVERIVHELQCWQTKACQGCHDDSKFPGAAPLLDLEGFWFGQRYAAILQAAGDAARVLSESDAALKAKATDVDALMHRGYALVALGRTAEARECFARIEWFAAEGRVGGKPRMMTAYP